MAELGRLPNEDTKTARWFRAEAIPHHSGSGFAARFAVPGMVPAVISDDGGSVRYETAAEAKTAALEALLERANAHPVQALRKASNNTVSYPRLTKAELAGELADLRRTFGTPEGFRSFEEFFAHLAGTHGRRVQGWVDGAQDIPLGITVTIWLLHKIAEYETVRPGVIDDLIEFIGAPAR